MKTMSYLFLLIFLVSCSQRTATTDASITEKAVSELEEDDLDRPAFVVVLCDVSGTVNRLNSRTSLNSLDAVIKNTEFIVNKKYTDGSTIVFLPISENRYSESLTKISLESVNAARAVVELQKRKNALDTLKINLKKLSITNHQNTCILTSIENAFGQFSSNQTTYPKSEYRYELIILSDLIEDCESTSMGVIDLETKLDSGVNSLNRFDSEVNLDKLNIRVRIVMTTQDVTAEFDKMLKVFWRKAFLRMGYSRANDLQFTQNV